jgi:hypothetical protein
MKTIAVLAAVAFASSLAVACTVSSDDASVDVSAETLTCATPPASMPDNPWWKTQYDNSVCANTNCGMASLAMLRYALTCGNSDHTGGWMRAQLNTLKNRPSDSCNGTDPSEWADLLGAITALDVVEHKFDGFTVDDLADKMSHGWKAVVPGSGQFGQNAPCNYDGDHALFIGNWDGSKFDVYDPDSHNDNGSAQHSNCGSTRVGYAVTRWTKDELATWAAGFPSSNKSNLWLIIARHP